MVMQGRVPQELSSTSRTARGQKIVVLASVSIPWPLVTCNKCALCNWTEAMLTLFLFWPLYRPITGLEVPRKIDTILTLPYLTLPPRWTGSYTCTALRPYQLGPMRVPECNHKVTGNGYKAVVGCKAETSRKALVMCSNLPTRVWSALGWWLLPSRF